MSTENSETVRWGWVIGCLAVGSALIGAAYLVDAQGITSSVLVEFGGTFALAGVVVLLERQFTRTVARASGAAVQQAAARIETRLLQRTEELSTRLEEVRGEVQQRVREYAATQDHLVRRFAEEPSYESLIAVLAEATRLGALRGGRITVPASADFRGIGLEFVTEQHAGIAPPVRIQLLRCPNPGTYDQLRVEWDPDEDLVEVGSQVVLALQRSGNWRGEDTLDWALALHNLQRALGLAISVRRGDPDAWTLHGEVFEYVNEDWVFTTAGLECPARGYFVERYEFTRLAVTGEAPAFVDRTFWLELLQRGTEVSGRLRLS